MEGKGKSDRHLTLLSDIDLAELSSVRDENDVFLSVYLPIGRKSDLNASYIASRSRDISKALGKDLSAVFGDTMEMVGEFLDGRPVPGERGRVVFASSRTGLLRKYRISVEPETRMVLDTSPFLLPLAMLQDEYEDLCLVLLDSRQARVMTVRSNILEDRERTKIDLMNKHKKGGWSQKRFNRLRRGAIHAFIREVASDLECIRQERMRGIIIAGPGEAKKMLAEELPKDLKDMVIGMVDTDIETPEGKLLSLAEEVAATDEREGEMRCVDELRAAIMKGEPASYGPGEVHTALTEARVRTLIILKGTSIPGWKCERCGRMVPGEAPPPECPACGGAPSVVDIVEEFFEMAETIGAFTEFVEDSPFLESLGGIAAILRY
ncbi:MAG: hypothetical protein DRN57_08465 [Thermoplasmata archaeon]|nr:MAG: hypothetical protein DRN57_08465 [Thermoplasmata archaeon]